MKGHAAFRLKKPPKTTRQLFIMTLHHKMTASEAVGSFVSHLIGLIKLIAAGKLGAEQASNGSCFGGGGGCCVFILGVAARAGLAS